MDDRHNRSTDHRDFQDLPQAIGVMFKEFPDGYITPFHIHERDQLLYATKGIMRLKTTEEAWIVPRENALYIPKGTQHSVSMHGEVHMRTLYIDTAAAETRSRKLGVLSVSALLRELILVLSEEPVRYDPDSRAGLIAKIIRLEIDLARGLSLNVPLPKDPRLQRLCAELLADPSDRRTLDAWSDIAGASARTLARLFERDLGMSFNTWRQRIRFHNALEALNHGEPISKVAKNHGYNSASAFSYAFRKVMGTIPSKISVDRPGFSVPTS